MSEDTWRRIIEACEPRTGGDLTRFLMAVCGVSQPTVSRWKNGPDHPSLANCIKLSKATGFNVQWIYTGEGDKRTRPGDDVTDELISLLDSLPEADRREVLRYARFRAGDA